MSVISRHKIQDNENDIESLFTNVPIKGAVQASLYKLANDPGLADRTTLTPTQIPNLLNVVLSHPRICSTMDQYMNNWTEQPWGTQSPRL